MPCTIGTALFAGSIVAMVGLGAWTGWFRPLVGPELGSDEYRSRPLRAQGFVFVAFAGIFAGLLLRTLGEC